MTPTGPRRRAVRGPQRAGERAPDSGFTLIEVLVATVLVGIVMTALTTFCVMAGSAMSQQSGKQVATQLAIDATERVRALKGSAIIAGRDQVSTGAQWASPVAGATPYLADMLPAYDDTAAFPSGATAPLPTTAETVTVNGVSYAQNWYLGNCWQPLAGGDCDATETSGYVELFRVVVAVTWSDKQCAGSACSYLTSTLVSSVVGDPVFNFSQSALPPKAVNPGDQTGFVSSAVSLQLASSGGAPPLTWAGVGLPPDLTVSSGGLITGIPTTVGTYNVTVSVTDGFGLIGTAAFTWTIKLQPKLTNPGPQTNPTGTAVSLPFPVTGGTAPFTWAATGLPAGLSIAPATGTVTGTPTTAGPAANVTVTVTDAKGLTDSVPFTWTITVAALSAQTPVAQAGEVGVAVTMLQATASGGAPPYVVWSASGLPAGLSIAPTTGRITGTPTTAAAYPNAKVTIRDTKNATATSSAFTWTIVAKPVVSAPTGARNNVKGNVISLQATVTAGTAPFTWTATVLPAGLTISPAGLISGTLTTGVVAATKVTVTDKFGIASTASFTWNVLAITSPTTASRTNAVNVTITTITPVKIGPGTGTLAWTVTGLPTGLAFLATTGRMSGKPTVKGTYNTVLTVKNTVTLLSTSVAFTWTIT